MTKKQFYEKARKIYGNNPLHWVFVCPWCKFEQSVASIRESINLNGYHLSMRYGKITKQNKEKLDPQIPQECLSPDCNYASYGLFGGDVEIEGHRYLALKEKVK